MKKLALLLVFVASFAFAQEATPSQLIQVPPKPTCVVILANGSCADLWRQYNTAVLQLYIARQKEAASAPLQQQITELNKLVAEQQAQIKNQQEQMQTNSAAALQAKTDAHSQGMQDGVGYGVTGALLLVGVVFTIKRMTKGLTITKKDHAKAASA